MQPEHLHCVEAPPEPSVEAAAVAVLCPAPSLPLRSASSLLPSSAPLSPPLQHPRQANAEHYKLARVAKEVLAAVPSPSCKVRSVAFDLAVTGDDARRGVARVAAAVEGRDVGVLVNNAGATYPCAAYFHEVEAPVWEAVVRVNVEAATRITRALLPMMAARGRGAVVNVGSGSSVVVPAFPLYAVYAASKA